MFLSLLFLQQRITKYKNQLKLRNTTTEMKRTLEVINSGVDATKECRGYLEDRIVEITQSEQQTEKRTKKLRIV